MERQPKLMELITKLQNDRKYIAIIMDSLLNKQDLRSLNYNDEEFKSKLEKTEDLKYNIAELEKIEEKINVMFPQGHKPMPSTLIPFGFYLGEILIKNIPGAKWVVPKEAEKDNNIWDIVVEFDIPTGGTMQARPFMRARKYWMNREDKMSTLVRMITFNSEINIDKEYWSKRADKDGWINMVWGDMFRFWKGDKKDKNFNKMKGVFHKGTFGEDTNNG